jgi:hypothetical protein
MKQQRKLQNKTTGMFAGPRGTVGQNLQGNAAATSGTTYGGQGLGWFWQGYPAVTAGLTEYDPRALHAGSNLSAVQQTRPGSEVVALEAGIADGIQTGSSVGGTAAY